MGMKVTRLWPFLKADYKAAEAYLTQQAACGLQFKSIGTYGFFAKYERTEPQQIQYCINVFSGNREERESYIVLAEDAGWHLEDEMQGRCFSHRGTEICRHLWRLTGAVNIVRSVNGIEGLKFRRESHYS